MTRVLLLLGVLSLALVGVALYVAATFALMGGRTPARDFAAWWRELVRESLYIMLTQPLVPLFYFFGRRFGGIWLVGIGARANDKGATTSETTPVIFVHGYMHNRVGFLGLARGLARRGLGPIYAINYPWFASIESNALRLAAFIERVRAETGAGRVDLVCHSMGGLVAMELLRQSARSDAGEISVRRCVTIASPHAGIAWRGPLFGAGGASLRHGSKLLMTQAAQKLAVPCLSIFSTHDNIVFPKETSLLHARGGRDVEVPHLAHLSILFSRAVASHVAEFLLEPDPKAAAGGVVPREAEFVEETAPPSQAASPIDSSLPPRTS